MADLLVISNNDKKECGKCVLALGTFDGVHIAHQRLIEEAIELKSRLSADSVGAWCFSDSPLSYLTGKSIPVLSNTEDKVNTMLSLGLDTVAVGEFKDFCNMSAEDFVGEVLKKRLNCVGVVCGFNHRFGKMGRGNAELLKRAFGDDAVVVVPEMKLDGETVSSSAIREHIQSGDIEKANSLLGRPFSFKSKVVCGKKLGRCLGFPTANQFFPEGIAVPKRGIYATLCITAKGEKYYGVSNVGVRPTIVDGSDTHKSNCETYIHGFSGDIYGELLTVSFCKYLRPEKKFDTVESLKEQIAVDLACALEYFQK